MRSTAQRQEDARRRLEGDRNIWLATASTAGVPHLIPLSLAWDGRHVLLATPTDSPTVRNAMATRRVRASLDNAEDVVLIEGTVQVVDFASADTELVEKFVRRVGWHPADEEGAWSLLVMTPETIRAWNGVAEITGRTVMRNGAWIEGRHQAP